MLCDRCKIKLTPEEEEAGFNSDMYESKSCLKCMKETTSEEENEDEDVSTMEDDDN